MKTYADKVLSKAIIMAFVKTENQSNIHQYYQVTGYTKLCYIYIMEYYSAVKRQLSKHSMT